MSCRALDAADEKRDKAVMADAHAIFSTKPEAPLGGCALIPGDKSVSHRALILGAAATGTTIIDGLLEGADVLATAEAMRALGASVTRRSNGQYEVTGVGPGGFQSPDKALDFANAGTGARLVMGLVAGAGIGATFTGDASLSSRPMGRIIRPLQKMGAQISAAKGDCLPITIAPSQLIAADITPEIASAQVKSAILLAALGTSGRTTVRESRPTRDHTENMLSLFGVNTDRGRDEAHDKAHDGAHYPVSLTGPAKLTATQIKVPGDPSSAAFPMVAALIVPGSDVVLQNVMLNKRRDGLIGVLQRMGGDIRPENQRQIGGETVADLRIRHSQLAGIEVEAALAPDMIDEYPALAVAAAAATGTTHMAGLAELRVKESDRLAAICDGLAQNGVAVTQGDDWLSVTGGGIGGGGIGGGGIVATHHDHRIAMAFLCLGLAAEKKVTIDDASMIATSFPNFFRLMNALGAPIGHDG